MTSGYTRQSAAEIQTGSVILSASLNDEYDALVAFADANTGHNHDGTTGGGAKIPSAGLSGVTSTSSGLIAATGVNTFAARTLTGTVNEITVTNGTGDSGNPTLSLPTALTFTGKTITGGTFTGGTINLASNTLTGTVAQFNTALSDGDFATLAGTETLTGKTINLVNNTITGTVAQFNTALSDGDFATLAGTETLTGKTINLTSNTLTGTVAQFNTALSDGDFATLAGTETLTGKTINLVNNTITGTVAQFNTALSDGDFATLAGTETLTGKTINLTSNTLTGTVAQFNTALSDGDFATTAFVQSAAPTRENNFRLTLTTGVPVTTTDVMGASTVFLTPYNGNQIALYSGTTWELLTTAQVSLALSGLTSGRPYDVFAWNNAGTVTLETLVWTNDTTRATALAYQDGVLVRSGSTTRRYLGTFYSTGATTTEDSQANRFLWNYYNRVQRFMVRYETTGSWTYSSTTVRQANGSTANQLNFVVGIAEDSVEASLVTAATQTIGGTAAYIGIGLNATTYNVRFIASGIYGNITHMTLPPTVVVPAIGRNYLAWIEQGVGTGVTTWQGGTVNGSYGLNGSFMG